MDVQGKESGTLVDISELGALLELVSPQRVDSHIPFDLHWDAGPVRLHGRVVRSTPRYEGPERVTWMEPTSYHVAVEFFDVEAQSVTTLRDLLRKAGESRTPE